MAWRGLWHGLWHGLQTFRRRRHPARPLLRFDDKTAVATLVHQPRLLGHALQADLRRATISLICRPERDGLPASVCVCVLVMVLVLVVVVMLVVCVGKGSG